MYGIAVDAVNGCSLLTVVAELGQTLFEITCDQRRRQQIVRGAAGTTGSGLLAGGVTFVHGVIAASEPHQDDQRGVLVGLQILDRRRRYMIDGIVLVVSLHLTRTIFAGA